MEMLSYIANILSTVTILSCLFLKVPQIVYIREKESAEGIYVQALMMEITGFTIMTLYNFTNHYNLMTYLEYPIILAQVYIMTYYVLKYNNMLSLPIVPVATIAYISTVFLFMTEIIPNTPLSYLVPLCTPLSGFAKVTYIYGIIKAQNADSISLTTWVISVATNLVRVFTVYVDSADVKLLMNFTISALLSSGVLVTALRYQTKSKARMAGAWVEPRARRRRSSHRTYHKQD